MSEPTTNWLQSLQTSAKAFVDRVMRPPRAREAAPELPPRTMPCELFLTMGWQSIQLFPSGHLDEFCFFQRGGVSLSHDVEFMARLDLEDVGTEDFKPYGMFKLSESGEPLVRLAHCERLWGILLDGYGLTSLPPVKSLASHRFTTYDPRYEVPGAGVNRISPPKSAKAYLRGKTRHYSYSDVLDILRAEMTTSEQIAWVEEAFAEAPPAGEIVHRYYLDRSKQTWLLRHHWSGSKTIYQAQTNAEALEFCVASGHFSRMHKRIAA